MRHEQGITSTGKHLSRGPPYTEGSKHPFAVSIASDLLPGPMQVVRPSSLIYFRQMDNFYFTYPLTVKIKLND